MSQWAWWRGLDGTPGGLYLNDLTLELLAKAAASHAEAWTDMVAPQRYDG